MSQWRFISLCFALLLHGVAAQAAALNTPGNVLYQGIATCLGRYAAQVDYAATVGHAGDSFRLRQNQFTELYDGMQAGRDMMMLRVRARQDHSRLLWAAARRDAPRQARLAAARVHSQLLACEGLVPE